MDDNLVSHANCRDHDVEHTSTGLCQHATLNRVWDINKSETRPPQPAPGRHIGTYALTTNLAPWVKKAIEHYKPTDEVLELVKPFAADIHETLDQERKASHGLRDLNATELTYQCTLEISAAVLLAADATDDPVELQLDLHASRAGGDDHFASWGKLLTKLDCDPPIIVQLAFYLLMCQSFTFEPNWHREDYVYAALTGVDWASISLYGSETRVPLTHLPKIDQGPEQVQPACRRLRGLGMGVPPQPRRQTIRRGSVFLALRSCLLAGYEWH